MSSFDKPVKVDENGNIDTSMIEKELSAALQFDIEYKQKDNMKKKAIKKAADYNEFKAMVDCAHLKTVTSKEVESLGKKKQGWQKSYVASNVGKAQILSEESERATHDRLADFNDDPVELPTEYVPASAIVMERDMRGLSSLDEQVVYLKKVGLKTTKKVLKVDCSADLLEMLIRAVLHARKRKMEQTGKDDAEEGIPSLNTFKWLKAASSFERFRLTMAFVPRELLVDVHSVLERLVEEAGEEERDDSDHLLGKFKSV